jgi:serine/threonine protein kinase
VFSLGGVVTFAVTGEPPFGAGSGTDLLFRIVHEQPDLDALRARDAELADVVASCLAKDLAERPSAAEILALVDQRTVAETGHLAWPALTMEQIAIRSEFAATATEAWESADDETNLEPDGEVPAQQTAPSTDPSAEAETMPVRFAPVTQHPKKEKDRNRRRLVLIVPLILATGTAGTVIAMHGVPFVSSARGGGTPTVSVSGVRPSAKVSMSASRRPSASESAKPTTSGSASGSAGSSAVSSSNANAVSQRKQSSGNSGSSSSSVSVGDAAATAAKTTAAAASGPSGPGSDAALVSGSEVSVNDCAGWLDYSSSYFFKGTVSSGSSANCEEEFYWAVTYYNSTPNPQPTADISASNGATAYATSCGTGNGCAYGAYEMGAKICVWNKGDSGDERCSAEFVYHNSTGTITQG